MLDREIEDEREAKVVGVLRFLVKEMEFPIDTLTAKSRRTVLHIACDSHVNERSIKEVVTFLLEHGADKTLRDANGETAG